MRRQKYILSVLCLGCAAVTAQAVPFVELIDAEVEIFAVIRDLSQTRAEWAGHPIAEQFEDPQLQGFFEMLAADREETEEAGPGFRAVMEEEFGLTEEAFFELFPGQASLSFYNMAALLLQQAERPDAVFMAEFSGDAARMEALMQIQFERNAKAQQVLNPEVEHVMIEESFMGETLYFDETFDGEATYIEDGYALVDGIFVLASPEERLRRVVEGIKEGMDTSIAGTDLYLRTREASAGGDLSVYLNLVEVMPELNAALVEQAGQGGLAMLGVTGLSLGNALSLDSMQALSVDLDLTDTGLRVDSGFIYREKAGLLSLLTYSDGALPAATYVPEGVLSSSVSLFDFGAMLSNLESMLAVASPSLPMLLDMQMKTMQTNTGIDLRASLLENLGGEVVSLSVLKKAGLSGIVSQPEQLYVIAVKDAQSLSQAIEGLKDLVPGARGLMETQEYAGQTIHTIPGQVNPEQADVPGNDLSYVITRSHLIVNMGRVGLLHEVLSRMDRSDGGFWQLPQTEQMFEEIGRPNPVTRSFVDLEQMVQPILQSIAQVAALGVLGQHVDAAKIPTKLEAPFRMVSEVNEAPDGFFSRTLIFNAGLGE